MIPCCPRCGERQCVPCSDTVEASDRSENVSATHRCVNPKCDGQAFRYTPGTRKEAA